jgi:hypothetical protein
MSWTNDKKWRIRMTEGSRVQRGWYRSSVGISCSNTVRLLDRATT